MLKKVSMGEMSVTYSNVMIILCLGLSPLLMGMEQGSHNHYLSQEIKALILFREKANFEWINGKYVPEVRDIIIKNVYMLYREQLLKENNNNTLYNKFVHNDIDDFAFVSINDKGRRHFEDLMQNVYFTTNKKYNDFIKLPPELQSKARPSILIEKDDWKIILSTGIGAAFGALSIFKPILKQCNWSISECFSSIAKKDLIEFWQLIGGGYCGYVIGDYLLNTSLGFRCYVEKPLLTQKELVMITAKKVTQEITVNRDKVKQEIRTQEKLVPNLIDLSEKNVTSLKNKKSSKRLSKLLSKRTALDFITTALGLKRTALDFIKLKNRE